MPIDLDDLLTRDGAAWRHELERLEPEQRERPEAAPPRAPWRALALVAALVVALAAGGLWLAREAGHDPIARTTGGTGSSCVGPQLEVSPRRARPGRQLSITGRYFLAYCADTGQEASPPTAVVRLWLFDARGRRFALTTATPTGRLGTFAVTAAVPADAAAGRALVTEIARHPGNSAGGRASVVIVR